MGDIRDQLQTLTGAQILPSQLSEAGGKVFVSSNAKITQADLKDVVNFWQNVHAPTYGLPIPSSGTSSTTVDTGDTLVDILGPASNETLYVTALSIENTDPLNSATVTIKIGDAVYATFDVGGNATKVVVGFTGSAPFFLVKGQTMQMQQTGATTGNLSAIASTSLSIQG
jgi:hypothetical protein